jgi:SAM-dependent methyltransferase
MTAHQRFQVPKKELFPLSYHYRSRFTEDVLKGMVELVDAVEQKKGELKNLNVLDIGCNDGSLLNIFAERGATTIGVEPTDAALEADQLKHRVFHDFFDEAAAEQIASEFSSIDVITFTNVFAHISDFSSLAKALKALMGEKTLVVIENHYLGSVIQRKQFDTFYHEHPRTYSLSSFIHVADRLDAAIEDVAFPRRYGGNIRVMLGRRSNALEGDDHLHQVLEKEKAFSTGMQELSGVIENWVPAMTEEITKRVEAHGPLPAKAFPGRAAILVTLLGLSQAEIEAVYEKHGSLKIGHVLPGTDIPIVSDQELFPKFDSTAVIVNFAWHIKAEIHPYLRYAGFRGEILDIFG